MAEQVTGTTPATGETQVTTEKTFTQDDVNRIVANRVAKYADYDELKQKAAAYDKAQEEGKSELRKATELAAAYKTELDQLKAENTVRDIRTEVGTAKGVPASLLTGSTKEECEKQADAILSFAKPKTYPSVRDGGEQIVDQKKSTSDSFADWAEEAFKGGL